MAKAPEIPASEPAFDLRKLMGEFDPNKLMGQFQTMLTQYKLPGLDIDKLIAAQQKNLEAVAEANRVVIEGIQALAKRQVEVVQETMKEASEVVSSLSKAGSPAEFAAKEAELGKSAFEKSVATMREMAEILVKSSQEATDKINARVTATLEEIRSLGSATK
jgi:phasin family protein